MRKFEKISFRQFAKDVLCGNYNDIVIPTRKTRNSAGYDFVSFADLEILPGEMKMVPTGVKAAMGDDEYLAIIVRSSIAIKHGVHLYNQVGIVDSDYYNNDSNEGHIWVPLKNDSNEVFMISKGSAFAQGIFTRYLLVDNDDTNSIRKGGIGSTDRSDKNE